MTKLPLIEQLTDGHAEAIEGHRYTGDKDPQLKVVMTQEMFDQLDEEVKSLRIDPTEQVGRSDPRTARFYGMSFEINPDATEWRIEKI